MTRERRRRERTRDVSESGYECSIASVPKLGYAKWFRGYAGRTFPR